MARIFIEESSLTAIANAIRAKTGRADALTVPNGMVNAINSIETGSGGNANAIKQDMANIIEGCISELENEYVYTVQDNFFMHYIDLTKINFANCMYVGKSSFEGCKALQEVKLPSLMNLDDRAFYECTGLLTADFTNLQTIGEYGLYQCRGLQTLTLPNLSSIDAYGLYGCTSLTKLDLGRNFTSWGDYAVGNCLDLETLIIRSDSYPIDIPLFLSDSKIGSGKGYIYVPASLLQDYINNEVNFASQLRAIEDYPSITGG